MSEKEKNATLKREKIDKALGAFAGDSFVLASNSDPMMGGKTMKRGKPKEEKGFLFTGGTTRIKKSKVLSEFVDSPLAPSLSPRSVPSNPSPSNTFVSKNKKRRTSLFHEFVQSEEMEEPAAQDADGKTSFLQTKNFSSLSSPQIIELLEEVEKNPQLDEVSILGIARQMSLLFATARCSLRVRICKTFIKLQPLQPALQTLLILTLNTADEDLQKKAANFLTSVMACLFSATMMPSFPSLQNLLKGCEFLVLSGTQDAGSEFVKDSVRSIQGVVDTKEAEKLYTTALTEENFKRELEKKEKEGSFVFLGWILCCSHENAKMISENSQVADTINEILKRENAIMKAFALLVFYQLYTIFRYKVSTSLLREIFLVPNQDQTIVDLAYSLKSALKRKK